MLEIYNNLQGHIQWLQHPLFPKKTITSANPMDRKHQSDVRNKGEQEKKVCELPIEKWTLTV